jgi:2-polyprenyl-3-methyl-5-hydroxy-6-metoxy-1,4-benzoquinol methylase
MPFVRADKPRLLEIGCGSGDFLIEAQSRGFEVEGLEYSEHAATAANTRLGRQAVRVGSPEEGCLPANRYDVISAFDVIEHLRDPKKSLNHLSAALKPRGLLVIVTPSLNSWSRRLLGRLWMEYKTEHLTYFSRSSLTRLLQATGFDAVQFFPNYKVLSLDYISFHFERFPVPVVGPFVQVFRRILPNKLVHRPTKIVASGITALARKSE